MVHPLVLDFAWRIGYNGVRTAVVHGQHDVWFLDVCLMGVAWGRLNVEHWDIWRGAWEENIVEVSATLNGHHFVSLVPIGNRLCMD